MPDMSLSDTVHRLMHTYKRLLRTGIHQQQLDLSVTQIRTLKGVCHNPNSTAHSIAQYMQRDKAQITRALNDLIDRELIYKTDNPHDRRSQLLLPTSKGSAVMCKLNAAEQWAVAQLTQDLTSEQLDAFLSITQLMISSSTSATNTH